MSEVKQHKFTAVIADADPIVFRIDASEELIYRRAVKHVNKFCNKMLEDQPGKSTHDVLANAALAFAELYYRKREQLDGQSRLIEEFEHELDEILLKLE